jgi:hypothetical protein
MGELRSKRLLISVLLTRSIIHVKKASRALPEPVEAHRLGQRPRSFWYQAKFYTNLSYIRPIRVAIVLPLLYGFFEQFKALFVGRVHVLFRTEGP